METKVTQNDIDKLLDSAEVVEFIAFDKVLIAVYRFPTRGGFTIVGTGACVNPANFDVEIGRKVARQDASNQLWRLEGYVLQLKLAELAEIKAALQRYGSKLLP